MAVRYALGAPVRPLVVTNIYNDPVFMVKRYYFPHLQKQVGFLVDMFSSDT
jgi:hypothetical protein